MTCYPLGVAAHIAIGLDCIRRGDLAGAASALSRAATLARDGEPAQAGLPARASGPVTVAAA